LIYLNLERECCQFNMTYLTEEKATDVRQQTARDSTTALLEAMIREAIVVQ
jgi:phage gp36-like protein